MKKIAHLGIVLLSMGLFVLSCGKDDGPDAPDQQNTLEINEVDPLSGPVGTLVTLEGENFGNTKEANTVKFNGVTATIKTASTTRLTIEVPEGAETGAITVKVGDNTATTSTDFTVTTQSGPDAITLNFTELDLHTLDTEQLEITNLDEFDDDVEVEWSGNYTGVLEIDGNGKVTALGASESPVAVAAQIGELKVTCTIKVLPSVFVAGYKNTGGGNVATVWRNGEEFLTIDGDGQDTQFNDVVIFDKFVCTAGKKAAGDNSFAMIWKNEEEFPLTDGTTTASAKAVYVQDDGLRIYAAGTVNNGDMSRAWIWENTGGKFPLQNEEMDSWANALAFNGDGETFAVGTRKDGNYLATVWDFGVQGASLTDETQNSYATDIFAFGGDFYIVGHEQQADLPLNYIAKAWDENGNELFAFTDGSNNSFAESVFVRDENNVLVVGTVELDGVSTATLWVNEDSQVLLEEPYARTYAESVFAHGDYVYVAGNITLNGLEDFPTAVLWKIDKNASVETIKLSQEGNGSKGRAYSVFVK